MMLSATAAETRADMLAQQADEETGRGDEKGWLGRLLGRGQN